MDREPVLWAFWGHEPLAFYKRRNGNRNTRFGNGEWVEAWHRRLHTEEAVSLLAGTGTNLIYTHYYKAMGMEFEREEMENTAKLVEIAHKYGIRVLGYATLSNVYDEALSCEIPDFDAMRCVRADGSTTDCYREALCLNSRYYSEYFPKVIEYGIKHVGLDGFHFDNATAQPCYCARCVAAFRQFLRDNIADPRSVGVPSFDHVKIPRIPLIRGTDAIALMAVRYFRHRYDSVYGSLFKYVKTLRPDALVLINSCFGNPQAGSDRVGYEIGIDRHSDFVFVENPDRFIGKYGDTYKQSVLTYKLANMAGKKAFNTMWEHFGVEPKTKTAMKRVIFEGMVFGGVAGTNWIARAVKSGSKMLLDDDMHFTTVRDCFSYFKQYRDIYANAVTRGDVEVLYLPDTRLFKGKAYDRIFHLAVDALAENGIVYKAVRLSDTSPSPGVMLIPDAEFLSDREVERLNELKAGGKKFVFLGDPGVYRDNGEERENWPFGGDKLIPLPAETAEAEAGFQKELAAAVPRSVRLSKEKLLVERAVTADGREVLHILNPDNDDPVRGLEIEIAGAGTLTGAISPDEAAPGYTVENGVIRLAVLDTLTTFIFERN